MMRKHHATVNIGGPVFDRILPGGEGILQDTWKCHDCDCTFAFDAGKDPKACPHCGIPIYGWTK